MKACKKCGALVADKKTHKRWHRTSRPTLLIDGAAIPGPPGPMGPMGPPGPPGPPYPQDNFPYTLPKVWC